MKAEAEQEIKEFKEKKEKEFAAMKEDVKLEYFSLFQLIYIYFLLKTIYLA